MAVTGWPTDAGVGQVATEARWIQMARLWAPEGVVDGITNKLAPSFAAGQVTVAAGAAWINGHYATNDAPVVVPTAANGLVVLRYTAAGSVFAIVFATGATDPTQTAAVYEIPIAQVTGGVMTDRRTMIGPASATPGVRLYRSAVLSFPNNAVTNVAFDAFDLDDGGSGIDWNGTANRVDITQAGWYHISGGLGFQHHGTGYRVLIIAHSTKGRIASEQMDPNTTAAVEAVMNAATTIYLDAGAWVALQGYQNSGAGLNLAINGQQVHLSVVRLGNRLTA